MWFSTDKMKKNITFSSGFNIIEYIIVIMIIGILVAAMTPTISRYLPGIQLNGSIRVLSANLREVQEKSITEQKQYLIRFYPTNIPPSYDLIRLHDGTEEVQKQVNLAHNETLVLDSTITNNQIAFSPDGGPSSSGNITFTINTISKTINVSPAGFIAVH